MKTIDLYEYPTEGAAQAAYVSSDSGSSILDSYSEANQDATVAVAATLRDEAGQAITLPSSIITKITFFFNNVLNN